MVPRLIRICRIQWWCSLLYFRSENPFFGRFRPKIQNFLKLNLVPWLIWIWRIQRWCSVFLGFFIINTLWGNFGPKNQIVSLSWNFVARLIRICLIEWWCSCFRPEIPFLKKFGPNNKDCQFKLKFATKIKSNMQNSIVVFTFSVFDRKYLFWANLVQKTKLSLKAAICS